MNYNTYLIADLQGKVTSTSTVAGIVLAEAEYAPVPTRQGQYVIPLSR